MTALLESFFVGIEAVKLTSQKGYKLVAKWILSLLSSLWIKCTLGSCLSSVFLFSECLCLNMWVINTRFLIMFIIMLRMVSVSNINLIMNRTLAHAFVMANSVLNNRSLCLWSIFLNTNMQRLSSFCWIWRDDNSVFRTEVVTLYPVNQTGSRT